MKKKSKKWIWIAVALVIVVAAYLFLTNGNRPAALALEKEIVATGSIESYYSFTGSVKVDDSESITASSDVTVRDIYVREGDRVEKNDRLMRTSDGTTIKAAVSGEVDRLHVEKDDEVKKGDALIDIVDFDSLIIEIKVDEFDVPSVSVGKTALVTVNALSDSFETTVKRLDRQATQEGNVSYYVATLEMGEMEGVLPGMQVDVKLLNAHVENVTVISMSALQFTDANEAYVMVQRGGVIENIPVSIGVNDGIRVEITSGINSGDAILLPEKAVTGGMMMMGGMGRME